jgi:hypothetical protein
VKLSPLIGPSMTQGAPIRSARNAARTVRMRQWPCGTFATNPSPCGHQPDCRVMSVLV